MARGDLLVTDIATFGQIGPTSSLIASLLGYYISSGGDQSLVYYGRTTAVSTVADSTVMAPKTAYASPSMLYSFEGMLDTPNVGLSTMLTVGIRGDTTNGYAVELFAYNVAGAGTAINIVRYVNGVRTLVDQEVDAFDTSTYHTFGISITDIPSGVLITVDVDGAEASSYTDTSAYVIEYGGNMWLNFDSTSVIESDDDAAILLKYFVLLYAASVTRDPQAMLRWSDDGGNTWSKERWESFGGLGAYSTRVKWNAMGSSRDRVYRFQISDPVKVVLINSHLRVSGENVSQ